MNDNQKNWKQRCATKNRYEIISIIIIALLLIIGIIFDLVETHILLIEEFSSVSLVALQIQASVSAISIALIALISGVISEEYYGISVSYYFLNIKPLIFKQNRIIIGLICLIAINFGAHLFGAYNLVIAILWVSCILIVVSVYELYSAFNGKNYIVNEIEMYLDYILFDLNISFDKKVDVFSDYVNYWSSIFQNKVDYENELERYSKVIGVLIQKDPERTLKLLQIISSELVKKFMAVSDTNKKYRAIEVFEKTYEQIWLYIVHNDLKHIDLEFEMYTECEEEILHGMYELPAETFKKVVHWDRLADIISRINIYCHTKEETDIASLMKYMKQIRWIPANVGGVLAKNRKKGERISSNYWDYVKIYGYFNDANIPENIIEDYKKIKRQYQFAFYYSLVKNCQYDIASSIFKNHFLQYDKNGYDNVIFILLIICYTYYIAECEGLECITVEEKNTAKEILNIFKDEKVFMNTLHQTSLKKFEIYDELRNVLTDYERMPLDGSCKLCIVDHVARDFVLLFSVLASGYGSNNNLLTSVIKNDNAVEWYALYLGNNYETTENILKKMIQRLSTESNHTLKMIERGLGEFNNIVLNKYKVQQMMKAKKDFSEFTLKNRNNKMIHEIEVLLKTHLCDKCKGWFVDPSKFYTEERFHLFKFTTPIDFLNENIGERIIPYVENNLIYTVIDRMYKLNKLELFERKKSNEKEYFSIIADNPCILVGPDFVFSPYDYKRRKEFDQITSDCSRINMGNGNTGILITGQGLTVGIINVSISIHHASIEECDYKIDTKTGLYMYSPTSGVTVQYTREELEEYIHDEIVVLDITVKLNIMNPTSKCGYYIEKSTNF